MNMVTVTHPKTGEKLQITEQEAVARGAKPSEEYMFKKAFKQQLESEMDPDVAAISKQPWVRSIAEGIHKIPGAPEALNTFMENPLVQGVESFSRGAVQTAGDTFASLANLLNKPINAVLGTDYNQKHPDFKKGIPYSLPNELAFLGGEIGGAFAGSGFGGAPGALQALQKIPRPQGWLGLAGDVASGAGLGYALGENAEGDRTLGTILGGVLGPLSSVTSRGISERLLKDRTRELARHEEGYDQIFKRAEDLDVRYSPDNLSQIGRNALVKHFGRLAKKLPEGYREPVVDFLRNATPRSAHKLQSELGKYMRAVEKGEAYKTHNLPHGKELTYEAAKKIRDALKKDVSGSLAKGGLIDESILYPAITKSYKENVVPLLHESIKDAATGDMFLKDLVKDLASDATFMKKQGMAKKYPEIGINQLLKSKKAKSAAATLATAGKAKANEKEPFIETPNYKVYD